MSKILQLQFAWGGGEATAVLADVEVAGMRSFCAINNSFGWQPRLRVWD